ncbi:unnamed protein product [Rhodiola kirilowii]
MKMSIKDEADQQQQQMSSSPPIPWKVRLFLSTFSFFVDLASRPNLTINRTLLSLVDLKSSNNNNPSKNLGVFTSDVTVDSSTNLWFRLFLPQDQNDQTTLLPVVIYFHGGGFICLAPNSQPYHDLCTRLAKELKAVVISVNYRLAPEHKYPAQYQDALQVLTFLDKHSSTVLPPNADLRKTFLAGDSAGANIAHHLAVRLSKGHEFKNEINVLGVMAIQAFFIGEELTESEKGMTNVPVVNMKGVDWACKAFLPEGADKDHPSLNVLKELREVSKYPATIVVVGGFDPLKDRQKMYYQELKRSGKEAYLVEYDNAFHTFYAFPEVPESWAMIGELSDFIKKQVAKV